MEDRDERVREFELKWFDMVMEEYNSLRNEAGDSLKHQQSIINYGLTAIGVLIAFSANLWGKEHIVESIYVLFIPFMCNLIILIWNGEVRRMSRAGQYIKRIEEKVHRQFSSRIDINEQALEWETFLRKPKEEEAETQERSRLKRMLGWIEGLFSFLFQKDEERNNKIKSNYIAIIIMFGGLSVLSVLLAFGHNFSMYQKETSLKGPELLNSWAAAEYGWLILYGVLLLVDFLFFVYHYRYFQKVKK
ncbi:hypothetical protein J7I93_18510 [Bacillus sp. ISL-47]|uniref:hypothetical protein n=1 Tax=Bacillus sp. ISL-47 TaxID=2819130 RepID=UPI001BE75B43|nr:hypothetical protein [Bacillus sp. ISL-47]MBT2690165.1 hypothetical protein [Bacillus sp. ISL-47]MBT2710386.1 hypothetical protein [Pseudomonas sp. ISL-84]